MARENRDGEVAIPDDQSTERSEPEATTGGQGRTAARVATIERPTLTIREILSTDLQSPAGTGGGHRRVVATIGVLGLCVGLAGGALAAVALRIGDNDRSAENVPPAGAVDESALPGSGSSASAAAAGPTSHTHQSDTSQAEVTARTSGTAAQPPMTEAEARVALAAVGLQRLVFVPHVVELAPQGDQALREFAEVLKRAPGVPVEFVIHTYTEPTPGQNHGLSVEQGELLRERLGEFGVDISTVAATGVGSPDAQSQLRDLVLVDSASTGLRAVDTASLAFDAGTATLKPISTNALDAARCGDGQRPGGAGQPCRLCHDRRRRRDRSRARATPVATVSSPSWQLAPWTAGGSPSWVSAQHRLQCRSTTS